MNRTVRLLISDDSSPARRGLCAVLETQPGIEIVGEAAQGLDTLALVEGAQPDVVLMDVRMPVMDGMQATRVIKARWPAVRVILISMYADHEREALKAGADAFVVKGCPAEELVTAIMAGPPEEEVSKE